MLGISIIAFSIFRGWDYIALISPIFVYYLLVNVSEIPMLEKLLMQSGEGRTILHKNKTNILFLRKPK